MSAELLEEGAEDCETIAVSWLLPMSQFPAGNIANARTVTMPGELLPFVLVNFLEGNEREDISAVDDLVEVKTLYPKGDGGATARRAWKQGWTAVHQRMLLLGRYLEDVPLPGGRIASIDYVDVAMRPRTHEFGDEQILCKVARYRMGLSYAKLS